MSARAFEFDGQVLATLSDGATLQATAEAVPEGAYTTLRTFGGDRVVRLADHVARLNESATLKDLTGTLTEDRVREGVALALRETGHPESRLRLTFVPPRLFIAVEPFTPLSPSLYEEGVACVTVPLRRVNPHAKDTRFAAQAASAYEGLPAEIHEGLMVAEDGSILEGLSSNFFALVDGTLRTEEARVLLGVTRSIVLDAARGIAPVVTDAIKMKSLASVAECFITSASRGILPVVRIDDQTIGGGRTGPVTRQLRNSFEGLVEREARSVFTEA